MSLQVKQRQDTPMSEESTRQFPCLVLASHGYVSMLFCLLTLGNARTDPLAVTNTVLEKYLLLIYGSRERCRTRAQLPAVT